MSKWYEDSIIDSGTAISSRVRLARNLSKFPFPLKLSKEQGEEMIKEVVSAIINERTPLTSHFKSFYMRDLSATEKDSLVERHIISPEFRSLNRPTNVLISNDENISIMISEEDHIRLQSVFPGNEIEKAWELADNVDNLIEETVEYAFDNDLGYLTSCPSNLGTGMRASLMLHLPALESNNQLENILKAVGKFGMTIRGTYGEGSESIGSIYQISNQITLGTTEKEIINNIKNITAQIIDQEEKLMIKMVKNQPLYMEDVIYRAYGMLTNARALSEKEALSFISSLKIGYNTGILKKQKPKTTIYNMIINIQPSNLQKMYDVSDYALLAKARASYIRDQFESD